MCEILIPDLQCCLIKYELIEDLKMNVVKIEFYWLIYTLSEL